ncbi:DivIVA domain-containing protein [Cecembia sp.]|uniref:DivIVA domain-containing protein n=1 Tax=Cecembia sp. TaxID=1898110 RepID=UPI0025BE3222|nr:DivIVA domain-containing protein [Cecembia sp.]
MKYTASEIRDKSFEKVFRGYNPDEVTEFLKILAEEFDELLHERNELERRLETVEREAKKLKDVEVSLFRTLKTAEDTGAAIIEEANKTAEELLQEAHQNSDSMVKAAQVQAQKMLENAEIKYEDILEGVKRNIKEAARDYDALINNRLLVLKNLTRISQDLGETLSNSEKGIETASFVSFHELLDRLDKERPDKHSLVEPKNEAEEESAATAIEEKLEADANPATTNMYEEQEQAIVPEETNEEAEISDKELRHGVDANQQNEEDMRKEEEEIEADKQKNKKEGSFFDQLD